MRVFELMPILPRTVVALWVCGAAAQSPGAKPVLAYLADFGKVNAIATDAEGNVYLAGETTSPVFPLVNAFAIKPGEGNCSMVPSRTFQPCGEAFVAKLDPTGSRLLYSTYLAGFGTDRATSIAVDPAGNAYVAGDTVSGDFPGSDPSEKRNAAQRTFAVKLTSTGQLAYARLFPGLAGHQTAIAADASGNAVIAGATTAWDFPAVRALQSRPLVHPLYATTNGGQTFRPLTFPEPVTAVHGLAIDSRNPAVMYAATERGLFKTSDGGAVWSAIYRDRNGGPVVAVLADPRNPDIVYAGSNTPVSNPENPLTLVKSLDGGATFRTLLTTLPRELFFPSITALAIDPNEPSRLWLGAGGAIYLSADGGETWRRSQSVLDILPGPVPPPGGFRGFTAISRILVDSTTPGRLYACCINRSGTGLFRSDDGGVTWVEGQPGPQAGSSGPVNPALDPRDGGLLFAPFYHGLARSRDAGMTWEDAPLPPEHRLDKFVDAAMDSSGNLYVLSDTGLVLRSADRARTFSASYGPWTRIAAAGIYNVRLAAFSPATPATFYVSAPATARTAFAAKLDPDGRVLWATLLGGSGEDEARAVAFDPAGNVYVAGSTSSKDFPTASPYQAARARALTGDLAGRDVFVTKIAADGSRLLYSTYLGGVGDDAANTIALGPDGRIHLGGEAGPGFPTAAPFLPPAELGGGFVATLDPPGQRLLLSSYAGNSWGGSVKSLIPVPGGAVYMSGCAGEGLPLVNPLDAASPGYATARGFLAALSPSGRSFDFSTLLFHCGYNGLKEGPVLALAPSGAMWVGGRASPNLPETGPGLGAAPEGYLARVDFLAPSAAVRIHSLRNAASLQLGEIFAPGTLASIFGENLSPSAATAGGLPLPRELGGVSVTVAGSAAPLLYVSPAQINFQIPFELPLGDVPLELRLGGAVTAARRVRVTTFSPGVFTVSGGGQGDGYVMRASDFSLITPGNPASPGETLVVYATGLGAVAGDAISGAPAPPMPVPVRAPEQIWVTVDSRSQRILYAGLAPGLVGVYQINFIFDPTPGPGPKRLWVSASNAVTVYAR